jgi:CrcB protein
MIKQLLLVALGGGVGSAARYLLARAIARYIPSIAVHFPLSTFIVNISGCFLAGFLAGLFPIAAGDHSPARLLLLTGFLGGYTTFSAFSIETLSLFQQGHLLVPLLYAASSLLLGLLAAYLGFRLSAL